MYSNFQISKEKNNNYTMKFTEENNHFRIDLNTTTINIHLTDLVKLLEELEFIVRFKNTTYLYVKSIPFSDDLTIKLSHINPVNSISCDKPLELLNFENKADLKDICGDCTACKNIKDFCISFRKKDIECEFPLYGDQLNNIITKIKNIIKNNNTI